MPQRIPLALARRAVLVRRQMSRTNMAEKGPKTYWQKPKAGGAESQWPYLERACSQQTTHLGHNLGLYLYRDIAPGREACWDAVHGPS